MTAAETSTEGWRQNLRGEAWLDGPRDAEWWTGCAPADAPGFDGQALRGLPLPDLTAATRESLQAYFDNGWALTELLFAGLNGEEPFFRPPYHHLRHPLVFYLVHPAAFYVNKLRVAGALEAPLNADHEGLFEVGVDEMTWDDMSKNGMTWPTVRAAHDYRREVHATVSKVIAEHPDLAPERLAEGPDNPVAWAVLMGFEHERIHLETSSVLIRELPVELVQRPAGWAPLHPSAGEGDDAVRPGAGVEAPANPFVEVPAGPALLGKPRSWPTFGWDNEYGELARDVPAFAATGQLISNAEYYPFVASGAYAERRWWTDDGWRWRTFRNARWPCFWRPVGPSGLHQYRLRTLFEEVSMPWSWPAVVNAHEARAFCGWRTAQDQAERPYRLLTEAEHARLRPARPEAPGDDPVVRLAGGAIGDEAGLNLALTWGGETPTDALPANEAGFRDAVGNVWQWGEDHFAALPGFDVHFLYEDFSTPCFDGEHDAILGGSFVSLGDLGSLFARFHFRPHFFQHAGFRMVRPGSAPAPRTCEVSPGPFVGRGPCCREGGAGAVEAYASQAVLDQYLLLHYGDAEATLGDKPGPHDALQFPQRCARLANENAAKLGAPTGRALDIGCAVGAASFELAKTYGQVDAFDLSESFVEAAKRLQSEGSLPYRRRDEGELVSDWTATVDPEVDRSRVTFRRGDACALPPDLEPYDAVLAANLLCRLTSPRAFLGRLTGARSLVRPGGLLVLVNPYTWLERFTPKAAWLGGYLDEDGNPVRSRDGLKAELEADYELIEERPLPLLIREHAQKFEYIVPHASVWRRKG